MADLGFAVNTHKHTVSNATLKKFAKFAVANISDAVSRTNGTVDLRPIHKGGRILGRAFTVKTAPGDNLMVHKAIDMAAPGDVIVVDAGGPQRNAIIGEIMSTLAESRKIAGFVIDGPIRDYDALSKGKFPVSRAQSPTAVLTKKDRARLMSPSVSMAWWCIRATSLWVITMGCSRFVLKSPINSQKQSPKSKRKKKRFSPKSPRARWIAAGSIRLCALKAF